MSAKEVGEMGGGRSKERRASREKGDNNDGEVAKTSQEHTERSLKV